MSAPLVAIDGPAGSGKSTIAAGVARALGLRHVDTGAFYRAATLAVLRAGVPVRSPSGCADVVRRITITQHDGRTYLDGELVESDIRGPSVTAAVSAVSAHPEVRALLIDAQRAHAGAAGAVVEGRDAGTVVVPDADVKVWLTASARERARRRSAQLGEQGDAAVDQHEVDLRRRDANDAAQMVPAPDAVVIDTTGREVAAVIAEIASLVRGAEVGDRRSASE